MIPGHRAPGVDNGRGMGGLVQLALKKIDVKRVRISTKSPRIQAQALSFPTCKVLWLNTYLPCDPQTQHFDDTELLQTLSEVENIIAASGGCEVIWAGDMNWDMSRNNHFTQIVGAAVQRLGLTSVWKDREISHTHVHTDYVSTSTLDHFILSPRLLNLVEECGPVHRGDNLSRHSPIFLSLRLGDLPLRQATEQPPPRRTPAWDRATDQEKAAYTAELERRLQEVQCPASMKNCVNMSCADSSHSEARDSSVLDILLALVETSYTKVPLTGGIPSSNQGGDGRPKHEVIPGWSTEVEPYRLIATSCHRAWLAAGKPRQGEVHTARLQSHAQFRYAVRRVKRASKLHRARGLFGAAMVGDIELMKEMKRLRTGKGPMEELADTVDGVTGENEVAGKFKEVYEALYNSSSSVNEMTTIKMKIQELIQVEDNEHEVSKVTADIVKQAVCMMKPHKMDVSQGFSSDAILHAPDLLFSLLALVFRDWLTHGTVTQSILACAFIPLVKNSLKDPALTESYRAIAGSSLLLKIFERCILIIWGDNMNSDTLQFGFKKKCSTSTATWLVQEVMRHYLHQGTKPIAVVLDCTKAFDLARFNLLFDRLLERAVPGIVVRVLVFSYQEQLAWTRWGRTCTSSTFGISNGTRQGSVASPMFWSVYLDPLLGQLREAGVGCHWVA